MRRRIVKKSNPMTLPRAGGQRKRFRIRTKTSPQKVEEARIRALSGYLLKAIREGGGLEGRR